MAVFLTGPTTTGIPNPKFVRRRASDGAYWSTAGTPAFEAYNASNIANYGITATEVGATATYTATDPAGATEGNFLFIAAAGASLVVSDIKNNVQWEDPAGASVSTAMFDDYANGTLNAGVLTVTQIAPNGIQASSIATGAITAAKIATGAITNAKFAAGAIDSTAAPNLDIAVSAVPAAWGASVIGNGRTRDYFLQGGSNKVVRSATTMTFYSTDDTTVLATGPATQDGSFLPLASFDPT